MESCSDTTFLMPPFAFRCSLRCLPTWC
jgi:hypothetical protein